MACSSEYRKLFGDRTYESGKKLLDKGAVHLVEKRGGSLWLYTVKDQSERNVVLWDRKGKITVECECSEKALGCRHSAAVYMQHTSGAAGALDEVKGIRDEIESLSHVSFDPKDYLDKIPLRTAMTQFYNYMQDKVLDKRIKSICRSIDEFTTGDQREELLALLWDACEGFESPHDEWSRDRIISFSGYDGYEDDEYL